MIDNDLSTPLLEVRFCIGDSSAELISDATINALLAANDDNINKTCLAALKAIVADLAKMANEELGDSKIWATDLYKQYSDLLNKLLKDPAYLGVPISHNFGGVSKAEVDRVNNNSDSRGAGISQGDYTSESSDKYNPYNPFFLRG